MTALSVSRRFEMFDDHDDEEVLGEPSDELRGKLTGGGTTGSRIGSW